MRKFYLTTAIAYTSAVPHIGNVYEAILADAICRYKRFKGFDVYFQTGTDEHGEKIELKAKDAGLEPQQFVDNVAGEIKNIWDLMNTTYDKFVRTTDPKHKEVVQRIFKKLYDQGDIYLGKYEGLYCTPCESFFTESQLIDGKCLLYAKLASNPQKTFTILNEPWLTGSAISPPGGDTAPTTVRVPSLVSSLLHKQSTLPALS